MEEEIMQQVNQDKNLSHLHVVLPENVEDDDSMDELLIEEVRNHGILWNTSLRDYKRWTVNTIKYMFVDEDRPGSDKDCWYWCRLLFRQL